MISLESVNGITAGGPAIVIEICLLWCPGIDSKWYHWGFFPLLPPTKPCALGSTQPLKMSTRDFSWGKGGRCVWLTNYHLVVPNVKKIRGLNLSGTPWACSGLLRDNLYLLWCGLILAGIPEFKRRSLLLWTVGSFVPRVCR